MENILSYNNSYFYHSFTLITTTFKEKRKRNWRRAEGTQFYTEMTLLLFQLFQLSMASQYSHFLFL